MMKKIILERRENEKGEKQKPSSESNCVQDMDVQGPSGIGGATTKPDNANANKNEETKVDNKEQAEGEVFALDLSVKGEKSKAKGRNNETMFSNIPGEFYVKKISQVVPCKTNMKKRFVSLNEGFSRVQLKQKRSETCSGEYDAYVKAVKEMNRNFDAENDEFQGIRMRNNELNVKNASDP